LTCKADGPVIRCCIAITTIVIVNLPPSNSFIKNLLNNNARGVLISCLMQFKNVETKSSAPAALLSLNLSYFFTAISSAMTENVTYTIVILFIYDNNLRIIL